MTDTPAKPKPDWVSGSGTFTKAWGLPIAALCASVFIEPALRTVVWFAALSWMGVACLMNAARCGRRHCYLTGPFFLIMALLALLHGLEYVRFGPNGWIWLALLIGLGNAILWYVPEKLWGKYIARDRL